MAEHTLKINAELDTSGLQGRLDQLNRNKGSQPGTGAGGTLAQQLSKLDRTLMRLEQAVNRLGRGQVQGPQSARTNQVVVGGMGGMGGRVPMFIPQLKGQTVTTNLMRDATAAAARYIRANQAEIISTRLSQ